MLTPEGLAATHVRAFAGQGRAWSAGEFADLLDNPRVFSCGTQEAFSLGRVVAGEAELLTIATEPDCRRRGLGRAVLAAFEDEARARDARQAYLEVAADNFAAIALYVSAGYRETGRRASYYARPDGARCAAVVMSKTLT